MFPLNTALALAIITTPVSEELHHEHLPCPVPTLLDMGVLLEVLDPRERRWCLDNDSPSHHYTLCEIQNMQRHYAELKDAPPLCDSSRFPSLEQSREMIECNRRYYYWLRDRRDLFGLYDDWIDDALSETQTLYDLWYCVANANRDGCFVHTRRKALKELRSLLGDYYYYTGYLPPPIPVWYLRHID